MGGPECPHTPAHARFVFGGHIEHGRGLGPEPEGFPPLGDGIADAGGDQALARPRVPEDAADLPRRDQALHDIAARGFRRAIVGRPEGELPRRRGRRIVQAKDAGYFRVQVVGGVQIVEPFVQVHVRVRG